VIRIPADVLARVYDHAREGYPEEVCGLLLGPRGEARVDEARRCKNAQNGRHAVDPAAFPRTAREAYMLEDADTFFVARSLSGERPVKVVYHSHVDHGAYFSATDRAAASFGGEPAYPGMEYLVVDARADGIGGAKLFGWDAAAGDFAATAEFGPPVRADRELDLRGLVCPFTFARTRLALEEMRPGQLLRVRVDNPDSARNVPRSLEAQGQDVISVGEAEPGVWEILVERGPDR
jgi:[CysO sulfur-carrier protein]-S-L-cysteine hydrolase